MTYEQLKQQAKKQGWRLTPITKGRYTLRAFEGAQGIYVCDSLAHVEYKLSTFTK